MWGGLDGAEDNELEETETKSPEELTQVYRLWRMFLNRLEGRGLGFADVALKERQTDTLFELCFTSIEVGILQHEWESVAELLKNAPANHNGVHGNSVRSIAPTPPDLSLLAAPPTSLPPLAKIEEWEGQLGNAFREIEMYSKEVEKVLRCIEDCRYRVSLYADFLKSRVKMLQQYSFAELEKIDDRESDLHSCCDENADRVLRLRESLSSELLPWLLTSQQILCAVTTSLNLSGRGVYRYALECEVLAPLHTH